MIATCSKRIQDESQRVDSYHHLSQRYIILFPLSSNLDKDSVHQLDG